MHLFASISIETETRERSKSRSECIDRYTMDELADAMEAAAEDAPSVPVETLFDVGSDAVGKSACPRDHVHKSDAVEDAVAWDGGAMAECDEEKEGEGEEAWAATTTTTTTTNRIPTNIRRCASPVPPGGRVGSHLRFNLEGAMLDAFGEVGVLSCSKGPPPSTVSAFGVVGVLSCSKGPSPSTVVGPREACRLAQFRAVG